MFSYQRLITEDLMIWNRSAGRKSSRNGGVIELTQEYKTLWDDNSYVRGVTSWQTRTVEHWTFRTKHLYKMSMWSNWSICPICWDSRIHRLYLCRGVRLRPTSVLIMTLNNLISEVPIMLELWGMRVTPLLPSLPGPLWPRSGNIWWGPIYTSNSTKLCI